MSGSANVVIFDYAGWSDAYPEFATTVTTAGQAQGYFDMASVYCDNTPCSGVPLTKGVSPYTTNVRQPILWALTAHIAQLTVGSVRPGSGVAAASPLVGRITTGTQGSVSVSTDMPTPRSAAWFVQTPYGANAWQAMAPYMVGIYAAPPQIPLASQSYPRLIGASLWQ